MKPPTIPRTISRKNPSPDLLTILLAMNPAMRPSKIHPMIDITYPLLLEEVPGWLADNYIISMCRGKSNIPNGDPPSTPASATAGAVLAYWSLASIPYLFAGAKLGDSPSPDGFRGAIQVPSHAAL